jgi:phosphatidylglycerophosphate synthase
MPLIGLIDANVIAVTIPLLAIFGGIAIAIVAIVMEGRKKELMHKERLLAMEKGIDIPTEPRKEERPQYLSNLTGGLVTFCLGVALTIALWAVAGSDGGVWGFIPMAIGIGLLIASALEKKQVDRARWQNQNSTE